MRDEPPIKANRYKKHVSVVAPAHHPEHPLNDRLTWKLQDLRRRSDRAAASFDSADFVHAVTRDGLFERLLPLVVDARRILDLGSATGSAGPQLRKRYSGAHVLSLDISHAMLVRARRKRSRFSFARTSFIQADASQLPLADQSIDLVFCNLLLPFIDDPERVFGEVSRVLRKGGVFAFAALGPDSLLELRRAWSQVDQHAHVNRFPDMHDIGDALVRSGLRDPVLDVDRLSIQYDSPKKLFADLTDVGARNALTQRDRSLTGRQHFNRMLGALTAASDKQSIKLELELVYGHCWGAGPRIAAGGVTIDASSIPHRRR